MERVDELGAHRGVYPLEGLSPKARERAMRTFLATHWKSIVALILLVLLAVVTMSPGSASDDLGFRLRQPVAANDRAPAYPI